MFGKDPYRGNTTPRQRLWRARDHYEYAKAAFERAEAELKEAQEEAEAFDRRPDREQYQGLGQLFGLF